MQDDKNLCDVRVYFVIHFMMDTGINTIDPRIFMDIILVLIDPVAIKIYKYRIVPHIPLFSGSYFQFV